MEILSQMSQSSVANSNTRSGVDFGTELGRDPVYLNGKVRNSEAFARAMLLLGNVVRSTAEVAKKDHSEYQKWVTAKYWEEMPEEEIKRLDKIAELKRQLDSERDQRAIINVEITKLEVNLIGTGSEIRKFWNWLFDKDRQMWIVLDPVVSVQEKATYFEAFSLDETVYVLVTLPHSELETADAPVMGTTNIDFGVLLEREFARVRSYRPLELSVGKAAVSVSTEVSSAVEKKIDLPDSWIEGLVQVSAAQCMTGVQFDLSSRFLGQVIAQLESKREKTGPRSLNFQLTPNEPIAVVIQPWGDVFIDETSIYQGSESQEIRMWGRRRLSLLRSLIPTSEKVGVTLLGDGMPSFWEIFDGQVSTTVGLSGWSSLDWSKKAHFAALLPKSSVSAEVREQVLGTLKSSGSIDPKELGFAMNMKPSEALSVLQDLAFQGKAMYLPKVKRFSYRELVPGWVPDQTRGLEERKGIELFEGKKVQQLNQEFAEGRSKINALVDGEKKVLIERDLDNRITQAQCSCSYFSFNKLRQGPCRHIVAVSLV